MADPIKTTIIANDDGTHSIKFTCDNPDVAAHLHDAVGKLHGVATAVMVGFNPEQQNPEKPLLAGEKPGKDGGRSV